jgi:hypothetical protein
MQFGGTPYGVPPLDFHYNRKADSRQAAFFRVRKETAFRFPPCGIGGLVAPEEKTRPKGASDPSPEATSL